jgi:SAM-dependent methyltransferase
MHKECHKFVNEVRKRFPFSFFRAKVLEVGSLNINGSVRKHFNLCRYKGIDLATGPGVDYVHDMTNPLSPMFGKFDVVISCEVLEHAQYWDALVNNMYESLKPGGLMIITCAGPARAEHGTMRTDAGSSPHTTDYYQNVSVSDFNTVAMRLGFSAYHIELRREDQDLVFYGKKA